MQLEELKGWGEEFAAFHERFADLFEREEPREQVQKYVRSLLARVERKNGWQLAEVSGDKTPDATQRLLYQAKWDADGARDRLQQFVVEVFGDAEASVSSTRQASSRKATSRSVSKGNIAARPASARTVRSAPF
jgi:SRSO17 transposase